MKLYIYILFILLIITIASTKFIGSNELVRTEKNYGVEVTKYAEIYDLPAPYLKALIVLESSGKKPANSRFEKRVYSKLKSKYKNLLSDAAIKNLSTSWGPFQLMGYQVNKLGIKINDIRGENSVKWGIKWINDTYGNYLREGKYEKAFRIHNTGKPNGRTFDPNYVNKGLHHIKYFENQ